MNERKFRSQMQLHGETGKDLASQLGITPASLSSKLRGHTAFKQDEIKFIKTHWNLTPSEVDSIFFADEPSCEEQTSY